MIETDFAGRFGIECTVGGQRLSWHLADYLTQLNRQVEEAFTAAEQTGT
jgi:beta-xylosidase